MTGEKKGGRDEVRRDGEREGSERGEKGRQQREKGVTEEK